MSTTLLRLGLWTLILTLGLFVLATSSERTFGELITTTLLRNMSLLAGALVVAGLIAGVFAKTAGKAMKQTKCRVCGTVIPHGAIYCRAHLRGMLEREDRRTHSTRLP